MSALMEAWHLQRRFGDVTAVADVSLLLSRGDVLGFLGPNGAGKTTTMRMLTGFVAPSGGRISVAGYPVPEKRREAARHIGYLPEGAPLYPEMTPAHYLHFIADIRGLRGAYRRERLEAMTAAWQLEDVSTRPIETLSKGFKRRLGLAQAMLHDPEILILDEPTDGLDPLQKHEVRQCLATMAPDKAILISTHALEEAQAVCNRLAIIAEGRIVADGTPPALWQQRGASGLEMLFHQLAASSPASASTSSPASASQGSSHA